MTRRDDFRGPLPLDDHDFAAIRARVMSAVARRERLRFPISLRLAMAAAVLAIIGLGLFLTSTRPTTPHQTRPPSASLSGAPPPSAAVTGVGAGVPQNTAAQTAVLQPAHHPSPHRESLKNAVSTAAAIVRMEIHTADPDVRIIWIAASRLEEQ